MFTLLWLLFTKSRNSLQNCSWLILFFLFTKFRSNMDYIWKIMQMLVVNSATTAVMLVKCKRLLPSWPACTLQYGALYAANCQVYELNVDILVVYSPSLILLDAISVPTIPQYCSQEHHIFESAVRNHTVLIIPPLLQCGVALTIASFQLNSKHHCTWWWSVWKCHVASMRVFKFQKLSGVVNAPCNLVHVVPCAASRSDMPVVLVKT